MIAGAIRYAREGLKVPAGVQNFTDEYKKEMMPVETFLFQNTSFEKNPAVAELTSTVFDVFIYWLWLNDAEPKYVPRNQQAFSRYASTIIEKTFLQKLDNAKFRTKEGRRLPLAFKTDIVCTSPRSDDPIAVIRREVLGNVVDIDDNPSAFARHRKKK